VEGPAPILAVDNNLRVRRQICTELGEAGYRVVDVTNGDQGLSALAERPFQLIVTDLLMPTGKGKQGFVQRCAEQFARVPLVATSDGADKEGLIASLRRGVVDYVTKPWTPGDLVRVVDRVLRKKRPPPPGQKPAAAVPVRRGAAPRTAEGVRALEQLRGPQAGGRPLPGSLLQQLLDEWAAGTLQLPAAPELALQLFQLLQSPELSAARLKDLLEKDPFLATRVLAIGSCPFYPGIGKVTELRSAVTRIGHRELRAVLATLFARQLFRAGVREAEPLLGRVWRHTWTRAVAMRFTAEEAPRAPVDPLTALAAGLSADLGAAFLLRKLALRGQPLLSADEQLELAAQHEFVGAALAHAWSLPQLCIEAAARHHEPVALEAAPPLLLLMAAAEVVCAELDLSGDLLPAPPLGDPSEALGLGPSTLGLVKARTSVYVELHAPLIENGLELPGQGA
jgi:HD-like signal output (HDOD) protein/CheY-like chemotaxis protein